MYNLQRITLLPVALSQSPPDPELIYEAMRDKIHQPYRKGLIPGLTTVLGSISPKTHPGLLGICLSGAGPTILALITENYEHISKSIMEILSQETVDGKPIRCDSMLLRLAEDGATVKEV